MNEPWDIFDALYNCIILENMAREYLTERAERKARRR